MPTFAAFLAGMAAPLAKRVLVALGFGFVSYAAISALINTAISSAKTAWGGLGGDTLSMIQLAGINTAMAIICGALVARAAIAAVKRLQLVG